MLNIIEKINQTHQIYPREISLTALFENRVLMNPTQEAVRFEEVGISYEALNQRVNQLARYLLQQNIKAGDVVALCLDRSVWMLTAMLAVMKLGAAYLPMDVKYPEERILYMLQHSAAKCLLTSGMTFSCLSPDIAQLEVQDLCIERMENSNLSLPVSAEALAYVIYTSGSTGHPKGVMISHRSVVNLIYSIQEKLKFNTEECILAITSVSFDIFVLESILPLCLGMKVILTPKDAQIKPKQMAQIIQENHVDIIQMTPSLFRILLSCQEGKESLRHLKKILIGGEVLALPLLEEIKRSTHARLYNLYGPTETTVWSTLQEVTHEKQISIGKPIGNTRVYLLDEEGNSLPLGETGELCIAGDGLARGYMKDPQLTAQRFVMHKEKEEERIYKTGDLASIGQDGSIHFVGRKDHQIKLKGHRIELGEIESQLLRMEEVKEAVVMLSESLTQEKSLHAFVTTQATVSIERLQAFLSKKLPDYMIPYFYTILTAMPTNVNGKIDRSALAKLEKRYDLDTRPTVNEDEEEILKRLRDMLSSLVQQPEWIQSLCPEDELKTIGMDSIRYVNLIVQIEQAFYIVFEDEYLEYSALGTLQKLSEYIKVLTGKIAEVNEIGATI